MGSHRFVPRLNIGDFVNAIAFFASKHKESLNASEIRFLKLLSYRVILMGTLGNPLAFLAFPIKNIICCSTIIGFTRISIILVVLSCFSMGIDDFRRFDPSHPQMARCLKILKLRPINQDANRVAMPHFASNFQDAWSTFYRQRHAESNCCSAI